MGDYADLPARTEEDSVPISGDINQLQDNIAAILQTGKAPWKAIATPGSNPSAGYYFIYTKSDGKVYILDSSGTEVAIGGVAGTFSFKPGDLYFPSSNPAPLDTDSGTNGTIKRYLFDDSTEEFLEGILVLPGTLSSGNVTFEFYGYPVTAAADDIVLKVYISARASGESWDSSFSALTSAALTCSASQDVQTRHTIQATIATLGWEANDIVRFRISRDAANGNDDLSGDWALTHFRIILP